MTSKRLIHAILFSFLLGLISGCTTSEEPRYLSINPVLPSDHATQEMIDVFNATEPKESSNFWDEVITGDSSGGWNNNENNLNSLNNIQNTNNTSSVTSENNGQDAETGMEPQEAQNVLREADIIHRDGNLLVVLSRVTGLYTVEVDDASQLNILDHMNLPGRPFEMTIRWDKAYITSTHTTGSENGNGEAVNTHSKLIVVDLADPSRLTKESTLPLDGMVTDTRMVGDYLYLVTTRPNGSVQLHQILSIDAREGVTPSVLATAQVTSPILGDTPVLYVSQTRLYLAASDLQQWTYTEPEFYDHVFLYSISGATGELTYTGTFDTLGPVFARWQLGEHEGRIRVITQPTFDIPVLESMDINLTWSSYNALSIQVPFEEVLKSVQYDADKAYIITALYTKRPVGELDEQEWDDWIGDPLYVIDMSNPLLPVQRGSLEMEGFVHFMQVSGSTMIGLAVNGDGASLSISLIDVGDMDNPALIQRLNMPGTFNELAEDFDRIHKALTVDWERGIILMPFSQSSVESSKGANTLDLYSGVQMFHFSPSSLTLAGTLPHVGYARRARLLDDNTVVTLGDLWLGLFDISDAQLPTITSELTLSHGAFHMSTTEEGDLIYLVQSGLGGAPEIHLQTPDRFGLPDPVRAFSLSAIGAGQDDPAATYLSLVPQYTEFVYRDHKAILAYGVNPPVDDLGCKPGSEDFDVARCAAPRTGIVVVDFSTETPTLLSHSVHEVTFPCVDGYKDQAILAAHHHGRLVAVRDDAVFFNHDRLVEIPLTAAPTPRILRENTAEERYHPFYVSPERLTLVEMEPWSQARVAFYAEGIELSSSAEATSRVNLPGSLIHLFDDGVTALLMDYEVDLERTHPNSCYSLSTNSWFDMDSAKCATMRYVLRLVRMGKDGTVTILSSQDFRAPIADILVSGNLVYLVEDSTLYAKYLVSIGQRSPSTFFYLNMVSVSDDTLVRLSERYAVTHPGGRLHKGADGALVITYDDGSLEVYAPKSHASEVVRVGVGSIPGQPRQIFQHGNTLYTTHGLAGVYTHETTLPAQ